MAKIKAKNVLFNILVIVTLVAVGTVAFNLITGAKCYAVTSDSMADRLERGDAVFSKPVDFEELKVGDIITVKVGNAGYFTHRIVDIDSQAKTVTTRGDANAADDPMPTEEKQIVGRLIFSIPFLGYLSIIFSGFSVYKVLIILVLVAAVLMAVNSILTKKKARGDSNE